MSRNRVRWKASGKDRTKNTGRGSDGVSQKRPRQRTPEEGETENIGRGSEEDQAENLGRGSDRGCPTKTRPRTSEEDRTGNFRKGPGENHIENARQGTEGEGICVTQAPGAKGTSPPGQFPAPQASPRETALGRPSSGPPPLPGSRRHGGER